MLSMAKRAQRRSNALRSGSEEMKTTSRGREAADRWLGSHLHEVGERSTVDLAELAPLRQDYHFGLATSPR
jgi:hypothetical protein